MEFAEVNYFAVGLAAVLVFVLGGLWYSPLLFANAWMAGHGYTEDDLKRMQAGMAPTYALSFICWVRDGDDSGRSRAALRRGRRRDGYT